MLAEAAGVDVLAVIKANGYGHGAALCAPVLARAGAAWLGVTDAGEGAAVLASLEGVEPRPRILVMNGLLAEDAAAIVAYNLTAVVWTIEQLEWLADAAMRSHAARPLAVHLEMDTGMSRQGVAPGADLERVLEWLATRPQIVLDGVMTHFASAEVAGSAQTALQRERFEQACCAIAGRGLRPAWLHAGNTSAIDNPGAPAHSKWLASIAATLNAQPMLRSGIGLYGYCLPVECSPGICDFVEAKIYEKLQPVMTWKTRVIDVRDVPVGEAIGYNGKFVAERPMRIALLPVGYADGLRRELSSTNDCNGGWVIVGGQRAAVVGRISMNLTTVDVNGLSGVKVGNEVVLLGDGITADDHARLARTISYEILCGVRAQSHLV
jgi:alanine racemase